MQTVGHKVPVFLACPVLEFLSVLVKEEQKALPSGAPKAAGFNHKAK